ncbi:porin [Leptobacterium sp. I13]|uniref:porin n=1 Tax=Leptobacterium meishanense TaxID=3128904 RepID=UPI0030EB8BEE
MFFKKYVFSLFFAIPVFLFSQEISIPPFGKGLLNIKAKDSSWAMKFALRIQSRAVFEWETQNSDLSNFSSDFLIRRAHLKFDGFVLNPKLQYKFVLGLSNIDASGASSFTGNAPRNIFDAVIKWNFKGNFYIWFGQTKLPGNLERIISSAELQFVERSLVDDNFNIDRDIGIQLRHHFKLNNNFIIREQVAISQGEGKNIVTGNLGGYEYTGRVELLPLGAFKKKGEFSQGDLRREEKPRLAIGIAYDFNDDAVRTKSNRGNHMVTNTGFHETDISTFFIDAMFKYKGFSFTGEYANRNADDPLAKNTDGSLTGDIVETGNGFNLQVGYLFRNNYEVSGRYTNISLDEVVTRKGMKNQFSLGFSKYIVSHKLKLQTDIRYLSLENNVDKLIYRLQMEVHF